MKAFKLLFFLVATSLSSQNIETIKLDLNISNGMYRDYRSLEVLDLRENKEVGTIFENGKENRIGFEKSAKEDIENWFKKYNRGKGDYELVVVLNELKAKRLEGKNGSVIGGTRFKASTFRKIDNKYYFLHKQDTLIFYQGKKVARDITKEIHSMLFHFFKRSYIEKPSEAHFMRDQLPDFEESYVKTLPAIRNEEFKQGIYLDFKSFFDQKPIETPANLDFNKRGMLVKATLEENSKTIRIPAKKIYAYTLNGVIYKRVECGYEDQEQTCFVDIKKGEKGFYTLRRRKDLLPISATNPVGYIVGGGMTGALIYALASSGDKKANERKFLDDEIHEFYIDPLTGNFIFDK